MTQDTKYAEFNALFHAIAGTHTAPTYETTVYALKSINRLFNQSYAICDTCVNNIADTYEYEGAEWAECPTCEAGAPTINDLVKMEAENA